MADIFIRAAWAILVSISFAILFNIRGRNIVLAGITGGIGMLCYLLLQPVSPYAAAFAASVAMTIYSETMARLVKAPATLFVVPGIITIVPGAGMYNSMLYALRNELDVALMTCFSTLLEAGAIAVGIIAVTSVMGAQKHRAAKA